MSKRIPKRISSKLLRRLNACENQVELFEATFPRGHKAGLAINSRNVQKARAAGLDIAWLVEAVLPAPAWAEYDKVRDAARAKYDKVCVAAWVKYAKVRAAARAEYYKVHDAAWAKYDKVCDAARAEYDKVRDAAFVQIASEQAGKT